MAITDFVPTRQDKIDYIKTADSKTLLDIFDSRARLNPMFDEDLELVREELLRRLGA